jgi:hypothetical protein
LCGSKSNDYFFITSVAAGAAASVAAGADAAGAATTGAAAGAAALEVAAFSPQAVKTKANRAAKTIERFISCSFGRLKLISKRYTRL